MRKLSCWPTWAGGPNDQQSCRAASSACLWSGSGRRPLGHHVAAAVDETAREMVADNVRESADVTAQIWDESTGAG